MQRQWRSSTLDAAFVLPGSFGAMLLLGAMAAALHGRLGLGLLGLVAGLVLCAAALAGPLAAAPLTVVGWLTVVGFSRAPFAQLQVRGTHPVRDGTVIAIAAVGGAAIGVAWRASNARQRIVLPVGRAGSTLDDVALRRLPQAPTIWAQFGMKVHDVRATRDGGDKMPLGSRRQLAAVALTLGGLPALTAVLAAFRADVGFADDLLLYLVAVIGITCVGGFWPAVVGAVASSLLLNWYFTPPLHTWTIDAPQNIFGLLLFVTAAVSVSSIVHVAARRAATARRSTAEATTLLDLARTVLAGRDTAAEVVGQMQEVLGLGVELRERVNGRWVSLAAAGVADGDCVVIDVRPDLQLLLSGAVQPASPRIIAGFAAQAAAALDRERLRVQAEQAEVFAAGNRMRNALLAAVGHDLRTPLASVKAAISSLRQTDITWSPTDREALLATVEEGADRLDGLIANLLDMSRLHTGSLQPFLRPTSVDEIVPLALRGHEGSVALDISDDLPMVIADPGLLERALANLIDNAARYSPADQPACIAARAAGGHLVIEVIDHGPGVPPSERQRIFQPFQQLGDQRNSTGVGLGLAVARGFVDALGGQVSAGPTPGGGLTVTVRLNVDSAIASDVAAAT